MLFRCDGAEQHDKNFKKYTLSDKVQLCPVRDMNEEVPGKMYFPEKLKNEKGSV